VVFRNLTTMSERLNSNADGFITSFVRSIMQFWHVRVFVLHTACWLEGTSKI
jgi:hypothetical protein